MHNMLNAITTNEKGTKITPIIYIYCQIQYIYYKFVHAVQ